MKSAVASKSDAEIMATINEAEMVEQMILNLYYQIYSKLIRID